MDTIIVKLPYLSILNIHGKYSYNTFFLISTNFKYSKLDKLHLISIHQDVLMKFDFVILHKLKVFLVIALLKFSPQDSNYDFFFYLGKF